MTNASARWRAPLARALATLQAWPWLETLKILRIRFREDHLGVTAASLSFTTLISLVPLLTVMLALFSAFPMFASLQVLLQKYFLQSLVPDTIAKPVLGALTEFATKASRLGIAGLVALLLSALALMLTIDRTLNGIWRVRTPRPIAQRVLVYWAAATLGPLLLGASLSLTSYALSTSQGFVGGMPGGIQLLLNLVEFALMAAAVAALFRYVPNTEVRWHHAITGGVFVAIALEVTKKALAWYVGKVPAYAMIYGAFATLPILFVWIYLGWVVVLLGAVIAAYAPSLQMRVQRWPDRPGSRFHLAVMVLRELVRTRSEAGHGMKIGEVAEHLRTDPLQIEPVLEQLRVLDWIGRLDEGGGSRYVLLCDPSKTSAQPMLGMFLLDPAPALRAFWQRAGFGEMTLYEVLNA